MCSVSSIQPPNSRRPSRGPRVVVVEPAEDRNANNRSRTRRRPRRSRRDELPNRLVRSCLVEVTAILEQHVEQMLLAEHHDLIQAFAADAAQEPLANRVALRRIWWQL